jgi:GntR family phosphonate transport system transcriptional regulator
MRPYAYPLHSQARFSQNLLVRAVTRPANVCWRCRVNGVTVCVIDHYLSDPDW